MIRDRIKDAEYLGVVTADYKEDVSYFRESIATGRAKPERHSELKEVMVYSGIMSSVGLYSLGMDKENVHTSVLESISVFEEGFKWEGFTNGYMQYDQMCWLISMAILADVGDEDFQRITAIIKRDRVRDRLLNFLIKFKQPDWSDAGGDFIQKSPYEKLKRAIDETSADAGIKEIQNYLKRDVWYKGHEDAAWHDSHLNTKVNTYVGYWSWEAAALVKAKGWDDEKLKDNEYYPYDAVHW
jgi:hypothetical protein